MERREPKERKRITGVGIVKAVTSGDSLIVMGGAARGALLSERQLTISGILAPKIARSNDAKDAEFAFASREYLRHACIGKRVKFFINHTRETRNYADVQLEGGMDLANYVLSGGYATVKVPDQGKIHPEKQQLVDIMEEAKKRKRGMWNTNLSNQVRDVNFSPDPRTLFEEHKGKAIPAIIDSVREGSVFRVQLLGKNLTHQVITLHLAGVVAPRIPKKDSKEASEPFADEARFYSEARLLHRDVKVCILAIDNSRNFIGSILYPRGNIAVNLLENGYGKFVKWSAAFTGNDKKLLAAQTLAQQRRANIWATFDPATVEAPLQEFQATVAKVWSGESITVESLGGAREQKRITLATIKCPRVGGRDMPDEPYAMKAREFVRSKLIGKKVLVLPEYTRKQNNRNGQRTQACTIKFVEGTGRLPNADLAEGLLAEGLATVLRHNIAEPRSRNYNRLLLAEERAIKNRKGMFSQNQTRPIIDYTVRNNSFKKKKKAASTEASEPEAKQPASRAREFLPSLQRGGTITAVVEHVFKSTHFKLYLPSHNSMLTLMLAGVRSPQFQTDAGDNQISNVATRYAAQRLTQRTVRVSIDALDGRDSNFIGSLALNKVNMSIHLASKGYAFVDNFSAGKTKYKSDLVKAEQEAKEAKAGMWENWVKPPTPVVSEDEDEKEKKSDSKKLSKPGDELLNVKVTEINDANNFYIQVVGDKALNVIEEGMTAFSDTVGDEVVEEVEVGSIYAAPFQDDGYHRVKVEGRVTGGDYKVLFVDYGNRTVLKGSELRALPKNLSSINPLARPALLAGLLSSFKPEYKNVSTHAFADLCYEKALLAKVEATDKFNKLHLSLFESGSPQSVNQQLVRAGLLRVVERPERGLNKALIAELKAGEALALESNLGVWEYGDVSDSDGETESKRENGKAARRVFSKPKPGSKR